MYGIGYLHSQRTIHCIFQYSVGLALHLLVQQGQGKPAKLLSGNEWPDVDELVRQEKEGSTSAWFLFQAVPRAIFPNQSCLASAWDMCPATYKQRDSGAWGLHRCHSRSAAGLCGL